MSGAPEASSVGPGSATFQDPPPVWRASSAAQIAAKRRLTPGSLKRLAIVANPGSSASLSCARPPRGERAHEYVLGGEAVDADAVPEEGAAAPAARRVHRRHRDLGLRELPHQTREQLVRQARLAGPAGAGDADHGRAVARARQG